MVGFLSVGSISAQERTQIAHTAFTGTRSLDTLRHILWPGMAPSRENANIIRDADVTDARPQNSWATQAMTSRNSAHCVPIDCSQMYFTANTYWRATSSAGPGIANVTATSRMKPNTTETTTDMTIPIAAVREALRVSSLMCAEASKPVIVYWAISRPMPATNQNTGLEKSTPENPEVLTVSVNTKLTDL